MMFKCQSFRLPSLPLLPKLNLGPLPEETVVEKAKERVRVRLEM